MPRATTKNHTISFDNFYLPKLKGLGGLYVDTGTSKVKTSWQANRAPKSVIDGFAHTWVLVEGAPKFILLDAARELHSKELYEFFKRFSIQPLGVATRAQWGVRSLS